MGINKKLFVSTVWDFADFRVIGIDLSPFCSQGKQFSFHCVDTAAVLSFVSWNGKCKYVDAELIHLGIQAFCDQGRIMYHTHSSQWSMSFDNPPIPSKPWQRGGINFGCKCVSKTQNWVWVRTMDESGKSLLWEKIKRLKIFTCGDHDKKETHPNSRNI